MILNKSQAEAVYSAICALNNVSGRATHLDMPMGSGEDAAVVARADGTVAVWQSCKGLVHVQENFASQPDFATAYGLQ